MVATPIGNLADIGLRALHVLALVDAVACEDSRVSGRLLRHFSIEKPLLTVHRHNERAAADQVLQRLAGGVRVAYVSDAGTPAVSDPGAALVRAVTDAGYRVVPIPGPSSPTAALSVAGDTLASGFRFGGFAPSKGAERQRAWDAACADAAAQVWLEAPHRIATLATEWAGRFGSRPVTLCRELTKQFESVVTLPASQLPQWLQGEPARTRGEFVLVLHALPPQRAASDAVGSETADSAESMRVLDVLLSELPLRQAVGLAVQLTGASRKALYAAALQRRDGGSPG